MDAPRPLQHAGFAVVRTPALPMQEWLAHAASASGEGDPWQRRADSARALFRRPLVAEAVYIASPSFHARLKRWDWRLRGAVDRKMLAAFERYLNRMCFRATPFGVFSTVSYAPLEHRAGWTLDDAAARAPVERAVRIDGEAMCTLCEKLHNPAADPALRYAVNASLYRAGDGFRFVDWTHRGRADRAYQIGEIDSHPLVDALLERMGERRLDPAAIAALVDELAREEDIDLPGLLDDMVAARVLLPALAPDPLNAAPSAALAAALSQHPAHTGDGARLAHLGEGLRAIPAEHALEHYMHFDRAIRDFSGADPLGLSLQVDAFRRDPSMAVDAALVDAATLALDWLMDRFSVRHGPLDSFCDAFVQRYGNGMVPLMEALDPECGVGYGHTVMSDKLLAGLGIAGPAPRAQAALSPLDRHLLALVQHDPALLTAPEIRITRDDAASLPLTREGHGGSGMAMVLHFPMMGGERAIALDGIDPDGAINWFSRFGHGEERIVEASRAFVRQVENGDGDDVLHAEIGFLAQARAVNLLSRTPLWSWRINIADPAIEGGACELPVSDLMIAVTGKDIQLWSRRLRKRVIPHLTSAHNAADPFNPPVYRFLCALRSHGMRVPKLAWGELFKQFDYLPRLRFESIVIAPARWRIAKASFPALQDGAPALRALVAERRVPRHVELVEGDNRLVLDLDDPIDILQLLRATKKGQDLLLAEVLDDMADADPAWRHELVVPLYRPSPAPVRQPAFARDLEQVPFAEALYVKLYGGQETLDKCVLPELAAWAAQQRKLGAANDWFFIRYADPGWHLRLRVFPRAGHDGALLAQLVQLAERLRGRGRIARFEFAAYERETIRYGGREHIGASEALFCIDSELAAAILAGEETAPRWQVALLAIDALLRDFGMHPSRKLALAEKLAAGYRDEFKLAKSQQAALGDLYRRHAREMLACLRRDAQAPVWSRELWNLLDGVSARRSALAAPLLAADAQLSIVSSHVHMLCNRLFMAQNREFEVVVYDFLARSYRALAAME
ncbi:lantibiotic dehydratase [Massilia terrae]|nr:lantibiotic dehydratase [Massilia terrae]